MTLEVVDAMNPGTSDGGDIQPTEAPQIDTSALARSITQDVLNGLRVQQGGAQQRSQLETAVQDLIDEGYKPDAIKAILKLRAAERSDDETRQRIDGQSAALHQLNQQCWQMGDEALSDYATVIPGFKYAQNGLLQEMSRLFETGKDFAAARERMAKGQAPSKADFKQAAKLVADAYSKEAGVQVRQPAAVDLGSSKPTAGSQAITRDDLSPDQKKFYAAVVSATGNRELALKRASQHKLA